MGNYVLVNINQALKNMTILYKLISATHAQLLRLGDGLL